MLVNRCIFCKIIQGDIQAYEIYENNDVFCIFDIFPANKGHTLIISKSHYENIFNTPYHILSSMAKVAGKLSSVLKKVLNCDGLNLIQNNGKISGQSIFHIHFHLIPRWANDKALSLWNSPQTSPGITYFLELQAQICKELKLYN